MIKAGGAALLNRSDPCLCWHDALLIVPRAVGTGHSRTAHTVTRNLTASDMASYRDLTGSDMAS